MISLKKKHLTLSITEKISRYFSNQEEQTALLEGNTGEWWCVSQGISAPIIEHDQNHAPVHFLPNGYDSLRFNHQTRLKWRNEMRAKYGFKENEIVFCFSAFGHFERKGLRQAVEVLNILQLRGFPAKLLIIGGKPKTIDHFTRTASNIDFTNIIFAGLVTEMEKHLSAADAFFFPSHFEAFALAEIEAAALGLRLYLTSHPGYEMILDEGINGRLLPWDVTGMAEVLVDEIRSGDVFLTHRETGLALTLSEYTATLVLLMKQAIDRKWPISAF